MFRYIKFIFDAKKGIEKPDELTTDLSFGLVEGFFILGLVISGLVAIASGFFGFRFELGFLKFIMMLSGLFFVVCLGLMIVLKRVVERIAKQATDSVKHRINNHRIVDVEAKE